MKRTNFSIVTLLAVAMMFVFASCTKDGVYKPKKKIAKIYETILTDPTPEKELAETWNWDGKLLTSIDYGDGDILKFSYDKKQLSSVTDGNERLDLTYDGKLLQTIKVSYDNVPSLTYTFQHEKGHISSYKVEFSGNASKKSCTRLIENAFRFIAPEIAHIEAEQCMKAFVSNTKSDGSYTVDFEYDGKNVVKQTYNYSTPIIYTYTYTEYKNPYYGLFAEEDMDVSSLSLNAPATAVRAEEGMPNIELEYTYKVDGKIPTQVIQNMRYTLSNGTEVRGETVSLDYEYTK